MPNRRVPGSASRPNCVWRADLLRPRRRAVWAAVAGGQQRVGGGVPHRGVDAVDDAVQVGGARAEQAVQALAVLLAGDLLGVGGGDGGDGAGEAEARLQGADAAVELDAVDGEAFGREAEPGQAVGGAPAGEGEVVDGEDGGRGWLAGEVEVGGKEASLPVMRVHQVRRPGGQEPLRDGGAGLAEGGEPLGVVGPVRAVRGVVGGARAVEEVGGVQDEEGEAGNGGGAEAGGGRP